MSFPSFQPVARLVLGLALLLSAPVAMAAQWLLASTRTEITTGGELALRVVAPAGTSAPDQLLATLLSGERRLPITLERQPDDGSGTHYHATLPADAQGLVTLELADAPSTRLLLQVVVPSRLASAIGEGLASAAPRREEPPSPSLQPNEPMYFLVGSSGTDTSARFQLSFKYRLFDPAGIASSFLPGVSRFYFGYTQTSSWDLSGDSKPFRETSYRPSLFYEWPMAGSPHLNLRAGYEHESNGRAGADSRSIDTLFVRPSWTFDLERGNFVQVTPKLWYYLERADNPDIARYRGYADLTLRAGDQSALVGQLQLRRGTAGKGSAQLDLSYRLKQSLFADVGGFLHLQYFTGYGESILEYNRRNRPEFRIGFSIVR